MDITGIQAELKEMVCAMKRKGLSKAKASLVATSDGLTSLLFYSYGGFSSDKHFELEKDGHRRAWDWIGALPDANAYAGDFSGPLVLAS